MPGVDAAYYVGNYLKKHYKYLVDEEPTVSDISGKKKGGNKRKTAMKIPTCRQLTAPQEVVTPAEVTVAMLSDYSLHIDFLFLFLSVILPY
jgi:hypothetical protein